MNWDNAEERLALIEQVGPDEYDRQVRAHHDSRPTVYPVGTRFGTIWAVKGTTTAYSTREQAIAAAAKGQSK